MEITAKLSYLRIAPRKVRLVADMIRNKKAIEASNSLAFSLKSGAEPMKKLLDGAMSNAKNNHKIEDENSLFISKITVDEGPMLKRWRARARGRAMQIQKKTSHIKIILTAKEDKKEVKKEVKSKKAKPVIKKKVVQK